MGTAVDGSNECLIIIDVVPYAREASLMADMSKAAGRQIVVVTDEQCHWAHDYTDLVVHAVSESDPKATREHLVQWKSTTRKLNVF